MRKITRGGQRRLSRSQPYEKLSAICLLGGVERLSPLLSMAPPIDAQVFHVAETNSNAANALPALYLGTAWSLQWSDFGCDSFAGGRSLSHGSTRQLFKIPMPCAHCRRVPIRLIIAPIENFHLRLLQLSRVCQKHSLLSKYKPVVYP
jgi:hypothetical protein